MPKKWWRVTAAVEAETIREALQTLRRVGTMPESLEEINDLGGYQMGTTTEMPSPWKPPATAPRNGDEFIGYDANTGFAETMRWDKDRNVFENMDHHPTNFTRWIQKPPQRGDASD